MKVRYYYNLDVVFSVDKYSFSAFDISETHSVIYLSSCTLAAGSSSSSKK
jgi:hypothetical protein